MKGYKIMNKNPSRIGKIWEQGKSIAVAKPKENRFKL
jgi:hypothetical protein